MTEPLGELPVAPPLRAGAAGDVVRLLRSGRILTLAAIAAWSGPATLAGSFYATWFVAWGVLGHAPRPSLDDPKSISLLVDLPYDVACFVVVSAPLWVFGGGAAVLWHAHNAGRQLLASLARVLLLWIAWVAAFLSLALEPRLLDWFMD